MGEDLIRKLASEQRRRLVATILGMLEREVFPLVDKKVKDEIREKVLDSVGIYHDFMLDVIKVNRDGVLQNEHAVELISQVHNQQRMLSRRFDQVVSAVSPEVVPTVLSEGVPS